MKQERVARGRLGGHVGMEKDTLADFAGDRHVKAMEEEGQTVGAEHVDIDLRIGRVEEDFPRLRGVRIETGFNEGFRTGSILHMHPRQSMNTVIGVDVQTIVFSLVDEIHAIPIARQNRMQKFSSDLTID